MAGQPDRLSSSQRWLNRTVAGLAVMVVILWVGMAEARNAQLYAQGQAAAAAADWPAAFTDFYELERRVPGYRDVPGRLNEAAHRAVAEIPLADLEGEAVLLRYLAGSGQDDVLAAALDRAVIDIPAGAFVMGSDLHHPDERPQHTVTLNAFAISRYEVTNVQYHRFLVETGRQPPPYWPDGAYPTGRPDDPVVGVSWADADAYCAWAGGRLPTEAEWEKSCRGADARLYPWGDVWSPDRANVYQEPARRAPHAGGQSTWDESWPLLLTPPARPQEPGLRPVGSYPAGASPFGVADLVGSVSEWVADYYNWNGYWGLPDSNPFVAEPPWNHVLRGSSWYEPHDSPAGVQERSRCAARNSSHSNGSLRVGFRCAFPTSAPLLRTASPDRLLHIPVKCGESAPISPPLSAQGRRLTWRQSHGTVDRQVAWSPADGHAARYVLCPGAGSSRQPAPSD